MELWEWKLVLLIRSIQWWLRSLVKSGPQNLECNPKETLLEFSGTSNSCLFPDAFIRIVAIRSANTVRVDCSASWSAASASSDSETSSCANDVWSSVISSCNIRISSIKAYLEMRANKLVVSLNREKEVSKDAYLLY